MIKETVLIIEDEPTINRIIGSYFKKENYNVLSALDGEKGLELFKNNKVDIICLDIMMPKIDGWNVAKKIREVSNVPIIMMSALSEEEDILKGFSLKINDYITKPFTPKILVAKMKSLLDTIHIAQNETTLSQILDIDGVNVDLNDFGDNRHLEELLTNDELTGIANRRYLEFYMNTLKKRVDEFNITFGILFIDIDFFKKVNDSFGHQAGDEIIKLVTSNIKKYLRNDDLVGRWGGEEFIAVLQLRNEQELNVIAEKLRNIIAKSSYNHSKTEKINVTVSIGGTMFKRGEDISSTIERADSNMYTSKKTGRNKTTVI